MSGGSLASRLAVSASMPRLKTARQKTVKVGFLAPLTGDVSAWGGPGLDGGRIWADWVNAAGGISIGGERYTVEIVPFDCQYEPNLALLGARKLVLEDGVKLLLMLGGDTFPPVQDFINAHKILTSTLLPSDLSPDTPYLIAPCEVHPIYNVTGVEWLAENRPELRTAALCAQRDSLGLPSIATYRAAFEAAGIELVKEIFFPVSTPDLGAVVDRLLEAGPDILCWDTAYEPFVHELTEAAFARGFTGQIISCTADNYRALVGRTSVEFMEGFVFQFPDFDDPALNAKGVNFRKPNEFFEEYNRRFPGTWSAVSWEYVSILELWKEAVEQAGTVEPVSVLAAIKSGGMGHHAFGEASWWGNELFGIDNALVGDWPVVVVRDGKARIAEFRSVPAWWERHGPLLERHMRNLGQMWDQQIAPAASEEDVLPRQFFLKKLISS
jgi:branched-chain amino acid transport system substrate-binding protein